MRRLTISLPDELALLLTREAARRSVSRSEVVRSALVGALAPAAGGDRRALPFPALGNSGLRDTSTRVEEILGAEWGSLQGR